MTYRNITKNELEYKFRYNQETGILTWRKRVSKQFNTRFAGKEAGYTVVTTDGNEYRQLTIYDKKCHVHRLIWRMMYGFWPEKLDHINGNGLDNRLKNLREATTSENAKNCKMRPDNSSGVVGVHPCKQTGKWSASIRSEGIDYWLGRHETLFEAVCVRKSAEVKYDFHQNHGREA